jgi:hypothetical protein
MSREKCCGKFKKKGKYCKDCPLINIDKKKDKKKKKKK